MLKLTTLSILTTLSTLSTLPTLLTMSTLLHLAHLLHQFLISLLLNKDELHHQNVIPFLQYQLVFSSCIYICVTFPGRFVLNSMQQNLSLWLKFYSVHSFHDVAISILFEVCHWHFIFVELSLDITLSQLIQSGPQALSIPHLLFVKLPPLLDKKGINIFNATSRKFEFESSHAEMSMNLKLNSRSDSALN